MAGINGLRPRVRTVADRGSAASRSTISLKPASKVLSFEWRKIDDPELTPHTREILVGIGERIPK